MRDTKLLEKYSEEQSKIAKEKLLFKDLKKEVETGANGTQQYVIKEGINKNKIAKGKIMTQLRKKVKKKKMDEQEPRMMGNPGVVKTYEDARENAMLNRNVPTLKHGGMCRGSGIAVKGKKFQGVF
jgi:hypothetical protein